MSSALTACLAVSLPWLGMKPSKTMIAAHGVVDLFFFVVLVEFREIDDAVPAAELRVAVNLKHHFF